MNQLLPTIVCQTAVQSRYESFPMLEWRESTDVELSSADCFDSSDTYRNVSKFSRYSR